FELLALAPAILGLAALRRQRYGWAGFWFGVGAAAKLWPGALGVGSAIALFAAGGKKNAGKLLFCLAAPGILFNAPVSLKNPLGWGATYVFHAQRLPDWGSVAFWIARRGHFSLGRVKDVGDWVSLAVLVGVCALTYLVSRKRPTPVATGAAVVLATLLLVNK